MAGAVIAGLSSMDQLLPVSYRTVSLRHWHDGTLVLLGDAAHALSPQLGQGANLSLMGMARLRVSVCKAITSLPSSR
jgi:2-polyprenyl-6-methoxyphenol hydroxylase-like FAD-dependent oxidoreductase